MKAELLDWLVEADAFLFRHEDVKDGEDGQPLPNEAMPAFRDPGNY